MGVVALSAWLLDLNLSIGWIRKCHLGLRVLAGLALAFFTFSFGQNKLLSLLVTWVISCGSELQDHLGRRTTAAFSTSDVQSQRMFNLLMGLFVFTGLLALLLDSAGINPLAPLGPLTIHLLPGHILTYLFIGFGIFLFIKKFWVLAKHFRTLVYLASSYTLSLRQGKLKRYW